MGAGDVLRAVQVPGRNVVQAVGKGGLAPERVEKVGGHRGNTTNLYVALRI